MARTERTRSKLSPREREILTLLADGQTQAQIASELYLSPKTVSTHIQHLLSKLGVHSRAQAVAAAFKLGLVAPEVEGHWLDEGDSLDRASQRPSDVTGATRAALRHALIVPGVWTETGRRTGSTYSPGLVTNVSLGQNLCGMGMRSAGTSQSRTWGIGGRTLRLTLTGVVVGVLVLAPSTGASPTAAGVGDDGIFSQAALAAPGTEALVVPANFQDTVVFSGLTQPTALQFAADGRVFVAEKSGLIKVFDNLSDTTPTVFTDLNVSVYNFWDRGLLGMALDPANSSLFVLYTYDADIGGTAPKYGTAGVYSDPCPTGRRRPPAVA